MRRKEKRLKIKQLVWKFKNLIKAKFKKKYAALLIICTLIFWVSDKACYCCRTIEGDVLDKINHISSNPLTILGTPLLSFYSSDFLFAFLISFLVFILIFTKKPKKNMRSGKEHGSAKWSDENEIRKYMDMDDLRNNIILTSTEGLTIAPYILIPVNGRNKNILVIGGSGAGKTRFFVIPNIMQMNSSYVITDPKGTILENVGYLLVKKGGYKIKILNLVDVKKSMHYNPLAYVKTELDVLKFANMLVESTKSKDEKADFWVKAEILLYQALVGIVVFEGLPKERTMETIITMINECIVNEEDDTFENAVDLMFKQLEEEKPDHFAVKQYKKFKLAAGKTAKSILISCGVRLSALDIDAIRELTSYDEMELEKIGEEKTAVFCITSDTDTSLNFLAAFMYMQMFNILCDIADNKHHGKLPIHVRCILDEFRNIGKTPSFEVLIATIRSRNISACPILQTKSQLKAMYKDDAETIAGCCDTTLFLGGQEKTTLKDMSELLGTETIEVLNSSTSYGRQRSDTASYQKTARKLMDESELFKLPGDKCILTIRGSDPWCSKKYDITKHPYYKYLGECKKEQLFDAEKYIKNYKKEKTNGNVKIKTDIKIGKKDEVYSYTI